MILVGSESLRTGTTTSSSTTTRTRNRGTGSDKLCQAGLPDSGPDSGAQTVSSHEWTNRNSRIRDSFCFQQ
eukprot:2886034-Rhodomonas_salina.1